MNKAIVIAAFGLLVWMTPFTVGEDSGKKDKATLPSYLTDVATASQKQQIRDIHEKYEKQIADLQSQIDTLTKQRDTEVDGLLNAVQKAKVKKVRDEADAAKKKADEDAKAVKARSTFGKSVSGTKRSG